MRIVDADKLIDAIRVDYYEHFTGCHSSSEIALLDMIIDDINELADANDKVYILPESDKPIKIVYQDNFRTTIDDSDSFEVEIKRTLSQLEKDKFINDVFGTTKIGVWDLTRK